MNEGRRRRTKGTARVWSTNGCNRRDAMNESSETNALVGGKEGRPVETQQQCDTAALLLKTYPTRQG